MSAPIGNQNAAKAKQWTSAIERALERLGNPKADPDKPIERTPKMRALDELADTFVLAAKAGPSYEKGDPWLGVVKEFGDRLDGKAAQSVALSGEVALRKAAELSDDQLLEIALASGPASP